MLLSEKICGEKKLAGGSIPFTATKESLKEAQKWGFWLPYIPIQV